jgi:hypothetical protein
MLLHSIAKLTSDAIFHKTALPNELLLDILQLTKKYIQTIRHMHSKESEIFELELDSSAHTDADDTSHPDDSRAKAIPDLWVEQILVLLEISSLLIMKGELFQLLMLHFCV